MPEIGLILEGISSLEDCGGVATWARNLIQSLSDHTFAVFYFMNPAYTISETIKYPNVTNHVKINSPIYPLDESVLFKTIHLENLPRCSLYHASSTGCASLLGMALAEKHKVPFLLTEHAIYWKELQYSHELECGIRMEPVYSENLHHIAQTAYRKATHITSPVNFIRNQQIEDGANSLKTVVIPNGIMVKSQKIKKEWDIQSIGFVGRITRIKNLELFVQIAEALLTFNKNLQYKIIGPVVDPYYFASLQDWIHEHSLQNNIVFSGHINNNEWCNEIDCLILTSQIESQPYVILEAFSHQIPVMAPSVGGIPETMENAGFIFSPDSPINEIAKNINSILLNPSVLKDFVASGWNLIQNKYHIDSMKNKFTMLYKHYLGAYVSG